MSTDKMPFSVYLLATCQALLMSGSSLLITASALVCMTLTEDKTLVTLPLSLQFLAQMLTSIPASLLMGKWGRRAGFMFGSLFGITGGCLAVYAIYNGYFWIFALASFFIGILNGFGTYFRFAAVDVVAVSNRAKAISYVMIGGVIAAFIGPNLANFGQGMVDEVPFVGGFVYVTMIYVFIFVVLFFIKLPPATIKDMHHTGRPLIQIATQPTFIVAVICGMLGYGVMTYVMTATPLAMHHHEHAFDQTAFVIQWHVLAMFAPSFFTGSIIQKIGVIKVMVIGAIMALTCTLINLSGTSVWHFWVALVALGISWNFLFIGASTLLTETYKPEEAPKSQALNDFMVFSTVTIASLSAGVFQNKFGWETVNVGGILFVGVILASIFWLVKMPVERRLAKV